MRSDTCNRYFCPGLIEFQQSLTAREPARGFFVSMSEGEVLGAAFCDEEASRIVSVSPESE
jgi:hypothetical protein